MLIEIKDLYHVFNPDTPIEKEALSGVSLGIEGGEFIALVGETGSGKTTLALNLNGLLTPTRGSIRVGDFICTANTKKTGRLREMVGMVFQYPEHQLFEQSVRAEISFGLRQRGGLAEDEIDGKVRWASSLVNLDFDLLSNRSPFNLSSGEQRKVAMASILAMETDILIFDEPTQGLDPKSRAETIGNIKELNLKGKTIIVISHDIEEILAVADRVVIMKGGKIVQSSPPEGLFSEKDTLKEIRPLLPEVTELLIELKEMGWDLNTDTYLAKDALREIMGVLKDENHTNSRRAL